MKKALVVTRVSGFVPQFEMSHVKLLQQMGYEVHYAANYHTIVYGKDNSRLDGTGIIRHQIDFERSPFSPSVIHTCRQMNALLEKEQFDLIHCHMPMSGVITRLCAAWMMKRGRCKKSPILYTGHGLHFYSGAPLKNWIYYPIERFLARVTDRLITINEEDYQRASHFPIRGTVEKIAGAGIDLSIWPLCGEDSLAVEQEKKLLDQKREEKRKELGITEGQFALISVGELTPRKNHRAVLQALKDSKDPDLCYLLCGSGPAEEELKQLATEYGISGQVIFAGYCSDIKDWLAAADCFIFPSLQEGLPMALMEAMAAGLPVIALPIRGNTDLITHKRGGYLVSPKSFVKAINKLKENPALRQRMAQWNVKQVKQFSKEIVDQQMKRIYESVDET